MATIAAFITSSKHKPRAVTHFTPGHHAVPPDGMTRKDRGRSGCEGSQPSRDAQWCLSHLPPQFSTQQTLYLPPKSMLNHAGQRKRYVEAKPNSERTLRRRPLHSHHPSMAHTGRMGEEDTAWEGEEYRW